MKRPLHAILLLLCAAAFAPAQAQQCEQYKQIRAAAPGGFANLAGEALDKTAAAATLKPAGATDCVVLKAGDKGFDGSPAQYSCRWQTARISADKALKEGYDLGNYIARCFGAQKEVKKKGNVQTFSVYPDGNPESGKAVLVFRVVTTPGNGGARHELTVRIE